MVYAGSIGKQKVSLGVSGRLDGREMRNLIMWDSETNSLWSQLKGEAVYGKSQGKKLGMLPAIFVGLGTWKQMHPKTLVLDMSTVRARSWFYKTTDMKRGSVRGRGGPLKIGLGVRSGGKALAVTNDRIRESGVVNATVGGVPLAFVWIAAHDVPLVYDRRIDGKTQEFELKNGKLESGKLTFDPLSGARETDKGPPLERFPYIPTYMKAWSGYYPKGATIH
jgi:Protein of unknown function (DUF3179)